MQDDAELDRLEQLMLTGTPVGRWNRRVETTATQGLEAFRLDNGLEVIAKPPSPQFGDTQLRIERAAWLVLRSLGWADLGSPVVLRPDRRTGHTWSFNLKAPHHPLVERLLVDRLPRHDVMRAGLFDIVVRNKDRLVRNWQVLQVGRDLRLFLFDNGYCFGLEPGNNPGSAFANACLQQGVEREYARTVVNASRALGEIDFTNLLPPPGVENMFRRIQQIEQRFAV